MIIGMAGLISNGVAGGAFVAVIYYVGLHDMFTCWYLLVRDCWLNVLTKPTSTQKVKDSWFKDKLKVESHTSTSKPLNFSANWKTTTFKNK